MVPIFLAGSTVVLSYWAVTPGAVADLRANVSGDARVLGLSLGLMFPKSFVSGIIFTLLGVRLQRLMSNEAQATGMLTLANTTGSLLGALLAGLVLLPRIGVEMSLFGLSLTYGVTVAIVASIKPKLRWSPSWAVAAVYLVTLVIFPFGAFQRHLDRLVETITQHDGISVVAQKEGISQTIQLVRRDVYSQPLWFRLMTNGHSMSATSTPARRYMKQYVFWPVATHGNVRSALLISSGLGVTAEALTNAPGIESITIVDPSRDIVAMSEHVFAGATDNPTRDPRVEIYFEDGRHFLHTTTSDFDLITGEPPPPGHAGIVSLYTREYFELTRARLKKRGVITYWLPVVQMQLSTAQAILRAFCDVYDDCSLWAGSGMNLMMVGTNGLNSAVSRQRFERQWHAQRGREELHALGFEEPGQLGASFVADASQIRTLIGDAPPSTDNFPRRLDHRRRDNNALKVYSEWLNTARTEKRFFESDWLARVWPMEAREGARAYFRFQPMMNFEPKLNDATTLKMLRTVLSQSSLVTPVYWMLGTSQRGQTDIDSALADGVIDGHEYGLAVRALAQRNYADAYKYLDQLEARPQFRIAALKVLSLCELGRIESAAEVEHAYQQKFGVELGVRCK